MTFLSTLGALGNMVEGSRCTTVVQNKGITRPGVAQELITDHAVVRTKYVHQATARYLDFLMDKAFQ